MCPTQSQLASRLMLAGTGDPPGGYRQPRTMPRRTVINSLRLRYVKRGGGAARIESRCLGPTGPPSATWPPLLYRAPPPEQGKIEVAPVYPSRAGPHASQREPHSMACLPAPTSRTKPAVRRTLYPPPWLLEPRAPVQPGLDPGMALGGSSAALTRATTDLTAEVDNASQPTKQRGRQVSRSGTTEVGRKAVEAYMPKSLPPDAPELRRLRVRSRASLPPGSRWAVPDWH